MKHLQLCIVPLRLQLLYLTLKGILHRLCLYIHHISLRVPYGIEMITKLLCKLAQSGGKVAHTTRNNLLLCCRPNPLPFLSSTGTQNNKLFEFYISLKNNYVVILR